MGDKVKGVAPGFLLIPAREYDWELESRVEIRLPNRGFVSEQAKDKPLTEGITFAGDDQFHIFEDNVLLLWEIVKVLFAGANYPHLEDNQCLNVVALEFDGDEVALHGEIIRSVV